MTYRTNPSKNSNLIGIKFFYKQIGFYFNVCDDPTWYDTGLRLSQNLCCDLDKGKKDPTYMSCDKFCEDGGQLKPCEDNEIA